MLNEVKNVHCKDMHEDVYSLLDIGTYVAFLNYQKLL